MTPRRIKAFLDLAERRRRLIAADTLMLNAYAAQGSVKGIQDTMKSLLK